MEEEDTELLKFVKFLAFKSTQIIVQSRLGGLIYTKCNNTGSDWVRRNYFTKWKFFPKVINKNKESIILKIILFNSSLRFHEQKRQELQDDVNY